MSDRDQFVRQIQGHLQSLREAGVEWLPLSPAAEPSSLAAAATAQPASLLGEDSPARVESALSLAERRQALQVLAEEVAGCCRCAELVATRTQTVFGDGTAGVDLCFVGEAPGADEDAQGLPFVGAAGQLLNKIIAACGFKREEVYICNILKCRPPGNRTPLPHEAANCRGFLERQIDLVKPKFICALGGCAASNLLQSTLSIGKMRGKFHDWRGFP